MLLALSLLGATAVPSVVPRAHGQSSPTPTLYLSPANTTTLPPPNTQVTFNVSVSNIPADPGLGGWDIIVSVADRTILDPFSITLIEHFSGTSTIFSNCVNGVGSSCGGSDGGGVAHLSVTGSSAPSGNLTLFSVTFNSLATTGYTSISLELDVGSAATSLISDPSGNPINADVKGAVYGNAASAPVAVFSWSPEIPYAGDAVTFNASLSYDPTGGKITTYYWPARTAVLPVTTLVFTSPGNQTITLTVKDDKGHLSLPVTHTITVKQRFIIDLNLSGVALSQYYGILPGTQVRITATVTNNGTQTVQSFNLTLKLGDQILAIIQNKTSLSLQQRAQSTYAWDTTGLRPDSYTIYAVVSTLQGDNDTQDKAVSVDVTIVQPREASPIPVGMLQLLIIAAITVFILGVAFYSQSQRRARRRQTQMEAL
jgi:PKD repeat protein